MVSDGFREISILFHLVLVLVWWLAGWSVQNLGCLSLELSLWILPRLRFLAVLQVALGLYHKYIVVAIATFSQ